MTATRPVALIAASLTALLYGCANGVEPERPSDSGAGTSGMSGAPGGSGASGASGGLGGVPVGSGGVRSTMSGGAGGAAGRGGSGGGLSQGGTAGAGTAGAGGVAAMGTGGGPPIPPAIGDLKVQYLAAGAPNDKEVKPHFNIVNTGTKAIPLADLTIRYFYTADGPPSGTDYQTLQLDYAAVTSAGTTVILSFGQVTPSETGADTYLEVGFTGTGTIGQQTGEIQTRVNWKGYTITYDETNDYSWDGTKTTFVDWPKATLYQRGVLIWGREPDGKVPAVGGADAGPPPRDAGPG
jgi:hypothetical protein